jgi:hypothetical protein
MRKSLLLSVTTAFTFTIAACGSSGSSGSAGSSTAPPAGTVAGNVAIGHGSGQQIYLCTLVNHLVGASGTPMPSDVDWSGIVSHGYSSKSGFSWQGVVRATGFYCTLESSFKATLSAGSGGRFTISGAAPREYALIVFLNPTASNSNADARLVSGANGMLLVVDLRGNHGVDVGTVKV